MCRLSLCRTEHPFFFVFFTTQLKKKECAVLLNWRMSFAFCVEGYEHAVPRELGTYIDTVLEEGLDVRLCLDFHKHAKHTKHAQQHEVEVEVDVTREPREPRREPHQNSHETRRRIISQPRVFVDWFVYAKSLPSWIFICSCLDLRTWQQMLDYLGAKQKITDALGLNHPPIRDYTMIYSMMCLELTGCAFNGLDITTKLQIANMIPPHDPDWEKWCVSQGLERTVKLTTPHSAETFAKTVNIPFAFVQRVNELRADVCFAGGSCIPTFNAKSQKTQKLLDESDVDVFVLCNARTGANLNCLFSTLETAGYFMFFKCKNTNDKANMDKHKDKSTNKAKDTSVKKTTQEHKEHQETVYELDVFECFSPSQRHIQVILCPTLNGLIESFDLPACSVAYDGKELSYTLAARRCWDRGYVLDVKDEDHAHTYSIHSIQDDNDNKFHLSNLCHRLIRYECKGFTLSDSTQRLVRNVIGQYPVANEVVAEVRSMATRWIRGLDTAMMLQVLQRENLLFIDPSYFASLDTLLQELKMLSPGHSVQAKRMSLFVNCNRNPKRPHAEVLEECEEDVFDVLS